MCTRVLKHKPGLCYQIMIYVRITHGLSEDTTLCNLSDTTSEEESYQHV